MKDKTYLAVRKLIVVLFAITIFGKLFYDYGCTGQVYGIYFTNDHSFLLSNIEWTDWIALLIIGVWLFLLIEPWLQYFTMHQKGCHTANNITSRSGLIFVFFTVINIFLAVACFFLNVRFGDKFDVQFGYDRLLLITAVVSIIYLPLSIVVILMNYRALKSSLHYSNYNEQTNSNIWQWILSSIVFIALGVSAFDGWYNWRYDFCCGRASQCIDGKWGYIDRLHRVAIPHVYDHAWDFSDGLACVGIGEKGNDKYGYIDCHGNIIIPLIYDSPADFINGVAYVKKNGKHGTINSDGKEMIPIIYDSVGFMFSENKGLSRVKFQDRVGFVRGNGDVVIPIVYEDAEYYFYEDLVRVKLYDKWGYLDCKGDVVIPMIYDEAGNFKDGRAEVQIEGEKFYIDVNGLKL